MSPARVNRVRVRTPSGREDRYLEALCIAYLMAPEASREEAMLEQCYHAACSRFGVIYPDDYMVSVVDVNKHFQLEPIPAGERDGDEVSTWQPAS